MFVQNIQVKFIHNLRHKTINNINIEEGELKSHFSMNEIIRYGGDNFGKLLEIVNYKDIPICLTVQVFERCILSVMKLDGTRRWEDNSRLDKSDTKMTAKNFQTMCWKNTYVVWRTVDE